MIPPGKDPIISAPPYVPQIVIAVAQGLAAPLVSNPTEWAAHSLAAIRRLVTHSKTKSVWVELRRRRGGASSGGPFVHEVNECVLTNHQSIDWMRELTKALPNDEQPQAQAQGMLFLEVASLCMATYGPQLRYKKEIEHHVQQHLDLADQLDKSSRTLREYGMSFCAPPVEVAADRCRERAS
jgi:hypothetical protein